MFKAKYRVVSVYADGRFITEASQKFRTLFFAKNSVRSHEHWRKQITRTHHIKYHWEVWSLETGECVFKPRTV